MKRSLAIVSHIALAFTLAASFPAAAQADEPLRVAVVGGIMMCGVWDKLIPRIEQATGVKILTTSAAPKMQIVPDFRDGKADLLLIHGGSETFGLQAEGIGGQQRVWGFNEHVIVGPSDDPAKIRTATDAHEAFELLAHSKSPFIDFRDPGSHEIVQNIWKRIHLQASTDWVKLDTTSRPQEILQLASTEHAYVVVGSIPAAFEKLHGDGLTILLKGDPAMRRAYVVMEPGPQHPASALARRQARLVADYLISPAGQADLVAADHAAAGPWIFPLPTTSSLAAAPSSHQGVGDASGQGHRSAP